MSKNGLTMTIVFVAESANYGEGLGNISNIKKKCMEFVENFDNPNQKNLLFTGNTGLR